MANIAHWFLQGVWQAPLLAALTGALSLLIPLFSPFSVLGAAAIALVMLRRGPAPAAVRALGLATLGAALFLLPLGGVPGAILLLLGLWGPVALLAWWLRRTVSLPQTLQLLTVIGLGLVGLQYALFPSPTEHWRELYEAVWTPYLERESLRLPEGITVADLIELQASLTTGLLGAAVMGLYGLSLLLGRLMQARAFNPGGFSAELGQLRLGAGLSYGMLALVLASLWLGSEWILHLLIVLLFLFTFQGAVVLHGLARRFRVGRTWIILTYILLVLLPQLTLVLAAFGASDHWLDLRRRVGGIDPPEPGPDAR